MQLRNVVRMVLTIKGESVFQSLVISGVIFSCFLIIIFLVVCKYCKGKQNQRESEVIARSTLRTAIDNENENEPDWLNRNRTFKLCLPSHPKGEHTPLIHI